MKPRADYRKSTHGQLKVIDAIEESNGRNNGGLWRCLCSCGQFINVRGYNLHSRTSCGCLGKKAAIQRGIGNRKPEEEKVITKAYQLYRRGAISPVDRAEWLRFVNDPCWYCGETERQRQIMMAESKLIACCDHCREMRNKLPHQQFIDHTNKISDYLSK